MKLKFTNIFPLLLSLLVCSSCVYDKYGVCPGEDIATPRKEQYVNLDLRISVNDGLPASRAADDFEGPTEKNNLENVHTLRVVIVRDNGKIEHNRMVTVRDNHGDIIQGEDIINDNLRFRVVAGEKKQIYLFANESAVNLYKDEFNFTDNLAVGKDFPKNDVANILITRPENEAFIDNNDGSQHYIPMSEFFEVIVDPFDEIPPKKSGVAEKFLKEELFLTRSLIKFSFSIRMKDVNDENASEALTALGMELKGVTITDLANEGFYVPNGTEYDFDKGETSKNKLGGREITSFNVPDNSGASECTFIFPEPLTISGNEENTYPLLYLPESKTDNSYKLSLRFNEDWLNDIYGSKDLEIKNIARNTHVHINILLNPADIEATVTVLPYTGVWLNPDFGIDRVDPVTDIKIYNGREAVTDEIEMTVDDEIQLTAEVVRGGEVDSESELDVEWISINDEIAEISKVDKDTGTATVIAKSPGTTTIFATYFNGKNSFCKVKVVEKGSSGE